MRANIHKSVTNGDIETVRCHLAATKSNERTVVETNVRLNNGTPIDASLKDLLHSVLKDESTKSLKSKKPRVSDILPDMKRAKAKRDDNVIQAPIIHALEGQAIIGSKLEQR